MNIKNEIRTLDDAMMSLELVSNSLVENSTDSESMVKDLRDAKHLVNRVLTLRRCSVVEPSVSRSGLNRMRVEH